MSFIGDLAFRLLYTLSGAVSFYLAIVAYHTYNYLSCGGYVMLTLYFAICLFKHIMNN